MTRAAVLRAVASAHRNWEVAMLEEAADVPWQGVNIPSVRIEALAVMKLRVGILPWGTIPGPAASDAS